MRLFYLCVYELTTYTYDTMGRRIAHSTVSGGTVRYTYNELNLKKELTNARGQKRKCFYDAMGRVTGYTSVEDTVSYTYDANGNVLTVSDKNGTVTRTFDALNRVVTYTDTYGKVIRYEYDAVGNLAKLTYPDGTAVQYSYDANNNLVRVLDWAGRITIYTYDQNNKVTGVTKPNGCKIKTIYGEGQRILSTVEYTSVGSLISGFEYTYDALSRIVEEKDLANATKMCYTYDELSRVTSCTAMSLCGEVLHTECFTYDAASNVTDCATDCCMQYDTQNRLTVYDGNAVNYDMDGNMLSHGSSKLAYDSANRLISAGQNAYTYNAEDVRIRNLCDGVETTYTYDTNCKLSRMLTKTTNGVTTKYVYGRGLIGEETNRQFKTYHFDFRGSTVAITNGSGAITDTFIYDTYGKLMARTGTTPVIFGYNGRDGVVTDANGLIYMRARYYSPDMRRFINADIVAGNISNAVTLNRYAYANGNPVSNIDPFGLSAERGSAYGNQSNNYIETSYDLAVLIANFRYGQGGLPVVGHTELYFMDNNGNWCMTEFTGNIKAGKQSAKVRFKKNVVPEIYNQETGAFEDVDGLSYVVYNGNFDESVKLAQQYADDQTFPRYNFLFNNCADYTDRILDVAQVNGTLSQMALDSDSPIAIPAVRVQESVVCQTIDTVVKDVAQGVKKAAKQFNNLVDKAWNKFKSWF